MDKTCRAVKKNLIDFIEKKLPADEILSIEEHRKDCIKCDFLIKRFSDIWSELPKIERVRPADSFWRGLQAKIQANESPQPVTDRLFADFKRILRPAALAILLLAGIYFGYQMGNITDHIGDIFNRRITGAESPGEAYVDSYFQDFQEILIGSPAEFYLLPISYKKD
ncbi:MAG: hypothetical protein JW755_04265 [Candidatus Aminicenantes bacterium]|nr:hypothetical protein [Candidatus Aminicenantes bacterium]